MLVGRDAECARIAGLLDDARLGRAGVLVLRGPPGIGKTALLEFAAQQAPDMTLLRAAGVESETEIAFSGLLDALRPLLPTLDTIPERQADALRSALALGPAVPGDRLAIGAATLSLLAGTAEQQPVLVTVDDGHWLDSASSEALLFATRRLEADAVAAVFAVREEGEEPEPYAPDLPELRLDGLDVDSTAQLLADLGAVVRPSEIEAVCRMTGGNPLALRDLISGDVLGPEMTPLDEPIRIGAKLERIYLGQYEGLSPGTRQVLLLAALDNEGDIRRLNRAGEVLGLDLSCLDEAEAIGLVGVEDDRIHFRHPLLRSAIYQGTAAPERRAAHAALAEALAQEDEASRAAWHRAAAAVLPNEDIAAALEAAARDALGRTGYGAAAVALERAARLTPTPDARGRRFVAAGEAMWHAGRTDRARSLLDEALETSRATHLRADVAQLRTYIDQGTTDFGEATRVLAKEGRRLAREDPQRAALMLAESTGDMSYGPQGDEVVAQARMAWELLTPDGAELEFRVGGALGATLIANGNIDDGRPFLDRSLGLYYANDGFGDLWSGQTAATFAGWLGRYEDAYRLSAQSMQEARQQGAAIPSILAGIFSLVFGFTIGRWSESYATGSESLAIARAVGHDVQAGTIYALLAQIDAPRGRRDECLAAIAEADRLRHHERFGLDIGVRVAASLELAGGRPEEAIRHLENDAFLFVEQSSFSTYGPAFDLIEAYVRAGQTERAEATLDDVEDRAHQRWALAALARCKGMVAADSDFEEPLRESVATFDELGVPFHKARSELWLGERLRRAGRRVDAREELRAALATFEKLGAAPWADRARQELRASGERLRKPSAQTREELTPRELQIALVVAEGKSNKEAAAELFLSPRTIEKHLTQIYRKLGVNSRGELIREFATAGGPRIPIDGQLAHERSSP